MYMDICLQYTIYYSYLYKALIQSLTDRYPLALEATISDF